MALLERNGGALFYEVHGDGVPIVILRGLGRSVRHWLGFEHDLAADFKVVTMDLRGCGRTTVPATRGMTIFDLASDVAAVLDAAGIEKAHVMGVSLGGMVTLAFGLEHSERCLSLTTIN